MRGIKLTGPTLLVGYGTRDMALLVYLYRVFLSSEWSGLRFVLRFDEL